MGLGCTRMPMGMHLQVNGKTISSMAQVSTYSPMEIAMRVISSSGRSVRWVCTIMPMGIRMMDIGIGIKRMELEPISLRVVRNMKGIWVYKIIIV